MRHFIYILQILLSSHIAVIGQEVENCKQIQVAFNYVEHNSINKEYFQVKNIKLHIDTTIQRWAGIPLMTDEYFPYKMGITWEEFQNHDTSITNEILRNNQKKLLIIDSTYSFDCFSIVKKKKPNVSVSFIRINKNELGVWIRRLTHRNKKHSFGKYLIFIFDEDNKIEKVFETGWIE